MAPRITHSFPATKQQIGAMRRVTEALLKSWLDVEELIEPAHDLLLALQEAVTNVIRHAYQGIDAVDGEEPKVELDFSFDEDAVQVAIRDWGHRFDPEQVPDPDFEDPTPGGYGVYIIRTVTDSFDYVREGKCNVLRMTKRFPDRKTTECTP